MTKVLCLHDNKEYMLVGTGYGMFKAQGQGGWGAFPSTSEGKSMVVAIADSQGRIRWIESNQIRVISIDGVPISDCLR